jgi:hypothetical protein
VYVAGCANPIPVPVPANSALKKKHQAFKADYGQSQLVLTLFDDLDRSNHAARSAGRRPSVDSRTSAPSSRRSRSTTGAASSSLTTIPRSARRSRRRTRSAFDPFIVGAGLRDDLIPAAHLKRVSRTAGWISAVVLIGGRAAGVWTSTMKGDRLSLTVDTFEEPADATRRAIQRAAERIASARSALEIAFGPGFVTAATTDDSRADR